VNQDFIGSPKLTRFERARVIGARSLQISLGAPVLLPPASNASSSPIDIAIMELDAGVLPMTIRRKMPDGTWVDVSLQDLKKSKK
jgi:DNA-directed RNA polymerase I, II, and III subunit RPABC2